MSIKTRFIIIILWSCLLNKIWKKRSYKQETWILAFIFAFVVTFTVFFILCVCLHYCRVCFHFTLKGRASLIGLVSQLCLSGNGFISPLFLKDSFIRYRIISWKFLFSLNTLNMSSHSLLASMDSDKQSAVIICRIPFKWWVTFLLLLSQYSLSMSFNTLITMCLRLDLF